MSLQARRVGQVLNPSISCQMHQKPSCSDPIPRVLPEVLLAPGSTSTSAWPSPKEDSLPLLHQLKAGNLFAFLLPVTLAQILDYSFCISFSPLLLLAEFIQLGLSSVTLPGGPGRSGEELGSAAETNEASGSERATLLPCCCDYILLEVNILGSRHCFQSLDGVDKTSHGFSVAWWQYT